MGKPKPHGRQQGKKPSKRLTGFALWRGARSQPIKEAAKKRRDKEKEAYGCSPSEAVENPGKVTLPTADGLMTFEHITKGWQLARFLPAAGWGDGPTVKTFGQPGLVGPGLAGLSAQECFKEAVTLADGFLDLSLLSSDLHIQPRCFESAPLKITVPSCALLGKSDAMSFKCWKKALEEMTNVWLRSAHYFKNDREIRSQIERFWNETSFEKLRQLAETEAYKMSLNILQDAGILLEVQLGEHVVVFVNSDTGEIVTALFPSVYSKEERTFTTGLYALYFLLGDHHGSNGHAKSGVSVTSVGLSTKNANCVDESSHLRRFHDKESDTVLKEILILMGVGWDRMASYLGVFFPSVFDRQTENAKTAAEGFQNVHGKRPFFVMPTETQLRAYLSMNRYTKVHCDDTDIGCSFQTYFGTTDEEASFGIPSLGFAVVHPAGGGCGNILFGKTLLHGSLSSHSGLRFLTAAFNELIIPACCVKGYKNGPGPRSDYK